MDFDHGPSRTMIAIIFLSIVAYFYLPDIVAIHWNLEGEADGFAEKVFGIILFPLISIFLYGLYRLLPLIDPKKNNIQKFLHHYAKFMTGLQIFFLYLFFLFLAYNSLGLFNFSQWLSLAFVLLLYLLGDLCQHAKQNYFIGFRTPWTLADEDVWNETHFRVGRLFKWISFLPLIAFISGQGFLGWVLLPLLISVVYGILLSYFLYKQFHPR